MEHQDSASENASTVPDEAVTQSDSSPALAALPSGARAGLLAGRYQILETVGTGGMGEVYRALDLDAQQTVAIKCLSTGRRDATTTISNPTVGRFRREFNVMVRLRHPNVVEVHDFGWLESGQPFLVMEFVKGQSLSQALRNLRQNPANAMPDVLLIESWHKMIWLQLCDALSYIHQNDMVHRDIKPGNLMLEAGNAGQLIHLKLMDFGLASFSQDSMDLTKTGSLIGTASYISPEQALGQRIDRRTDLYALGVLMYEMVTGRALFSADQPWAIVRMHIEAVPVPPIFLNPAIPVYINAIILNLLAKQPEQRFNSAEDVADALRTKHMPEAVLAQASAATERAGLLGRITEFQTLRENCEQAWKQSQLVCISLEGEAGLGKSYLLNALMGWAKQTQASVMSGVCAATARMPYGAVAEAISTHLISRRQNKIRSQLLRNIKTEIARIVPEISSRGSASRLAETAEAQSNPTQSQARLFGAVAQLMARVTAHKPVLWIIDDAQWLSDDALELLAYIANHNLHTPMCVVLSQRPDAMALTTQQSHLKFTARIQLNPIPESDVRQLAQQVLGQRASPNALDVIVARADGNPLFVQELANMLKVANTSTEAMESVTQTVNLPVPVRIARVMANRLSELNDEQRNLMSWAAICGREFNLDMLAQAATENADDWAALVDDLLKRQLLLEKRVTGREVYRFAHQQLRELVYERLQPESRHQMHSAFADVLERDELAAPADLELQFAEAGRLQKAMEYGLIAGDRAREVYAHRDAQAFYERVLARAANSVEFHEQVAQAHFGLGETHFFLGRYVQARREFEQVVALTV